MLNKIKSLDGEAMTDLGRKEERVCRKGGFNFE